MRRLFTVVILLCVIVLGVVGCDTPAAAPSPTSEPADAEPTDAPEPTEEPADLPDPTSTPEPTEEQTDAPEPTEEPTEEPTVDTMGIETPTPITAVEEPAASGSFAPTANSVWNISPTSSTITGSCAGGDVIDFCASMVAIAPAGGDLTWRGQDGNIYTLSAIDPNHYQGGGPSFLRGYMLAIDLTFVDATTMSATYTLIPDDDPTCNYIYQYQGSLAW